MASPTPVHADHQLDQCAGPLAHWRQTRPRPGAPIPPALWDPAVTCTAVLPPARVAPQLRVRVADLPKQMMARQATPSVGLPAAGGLVEVPPASPQPRATPTIHRELSRADGTRVCLHAPGATLPLAALFRAFVEGR